MQLVTRSYRDGSSTSQYPVKALPETISSALTGYMGIIPDEIQTRILAARGRKEARQVIRLGMKGSIAAVGETRLFTPPRPYSILSAYEFIKFTEYKYNIVGLDKGMVKIDTTKEAEHVTPMKICTYYLPFTILVNSEEGNYRKRTSSYRERILAIYKRAADVYNPANIHHVYVVDGPDIGREVGTNTVRFQSYRALIIEGDKVYDDIVVDPSGYGEPNYKDWNRHVYTSNKFDRKRKAEESKAKFYRERAIGPVVMEAVKTATKSKGQLYLAESVTPYYGYWSEKGVKIVARKREMGYSLEEDERIPVDPNKIYKLVYPPVTQTAKSAFTLVYNELVTQPDEYWAGRLRYSINDNTSVPSAIDVFAKSRLVYRAKGSGGNECTHFTMKPELANLLRPMYFSDEFKAIFEKMNPGADCDLSKMTPEEHHELYKDLILKDLNRMRRTPQSFIGLLFPKEETD